MELSEVRPLDIWVLLAVGMVWELVTRGWLLVLKMKPQSLLDKELALAIQQKETDQLRKMGPSKFVETSKLERQVLAKEKELTQIKEERQKRQEAAEKTLSRYGNMTVAGIVFVLFYGVPVMTLVTPDTDPSVMEDTVASPSLKDMMFPVGHLGLGMRLARWGLEDANNSMGALVVMWSGQVFVSKIMDAMDAFLLV
mmetsp:Transcript_27584/g.57735  ORF Transcript_27584/g.57735 Transcript_27584/m.57735 type:complete len:197 (-) Transcript_27584:200-790(-)